MSQENDRLKNMLQENKISIDEYKLLTAALEKKNSRVYPVFSFLINPFQKIAGLWALIAGAVIILAMSYIGLTAQVYYPGILGALNASVVKNPKMPMNFSLLLTQNLISWGILTALFIIGAIIFHQKRIRIIDFLGTVALSRFPTLVLTIILAIIRVVSPSFLNIDLTKGYDFHPSLAMSAFLVLGLTWAIWQIATYYFALKESSGLTGKKLWVCFIVAVIAGEVISSYINMSFV